MYFEWDSSKSERTRHTRGFGFDYAIRIFVGRTIEAAAKSVTGELRIKAIGSVEGDVLVEIYTERVSARRIISARLASRKERKLWDA